MYWISQTTGKCLTMNHLQHCLKRNFGGKVNVDEMVERFLRNVPAYLIVSEQRPSDVEVRMYIVVIRTNYISLFLICSTMIVPHMD